jgi:phenylalanyl-tRNA synthetase beta subunit
MLYPDVGEPVAIGYAGMLHPEVIANFELGFVAFLIHLHFLWFSFFFFFLSKSFLNHLCL